MKSVSLIVQFAECSVGCGHRLWTIRGQGRHIPHRNASMVRRVFGDIDIDLDVAELHIAACLDAGPNGVSAEGELYSDDIMELFGKHTCHFLRADEFFGVAWWRSSDLHIQSREHDSVARLVTGDDPIRPVLDPVLPVFHTNQMGRRGLSAPSEMKSQGGHINALSIDPEKGPCGSIDRSCWN